jgi:hypothetical protein
MIDEEAAEQLIGKVDQGSLNIRPDPGYPKPG